MARLLGASLFAAFAMLGLGAVPTIADACPMQNAEAEANSSPVQLAMEDTDTGSDEAANRDEDRDGETSE